MGGRGSSSGANSAEKRAEKYASQIKSQISASERAYDVSFSDVGIRQTAPRRGTNLKIGDTLSMRTIASDKQRNGWTLVEGGGKINNTYSTKITDIKATGTTITIFGEIKVAGRQGITTKAVKKRFNKSDRFVIER